MCKFGIEITPVSSGTTCPESLAQYDRNIQSALRNLNFFNLFPLLTFLL